MFDDADARWMRAALTLARRGLGRVAPNPAVGCVIVKDGVVLDAKDLLDSLMGERRNSAQKAGGGPSAEPLSLRTAKYSLLVQPAIMPSAV